MSSTNVIFMYAGKANVKTLDVIPYVVSCLNPLNTLHLLISIWEAIIFI
jgi:hypothetical protein